MNGYLFLIDMPWKSTLLLGTVVVIGAIVRKRVSASTRHVVWAVGIIGALLLPLLSVSMPKIGVVVPSRVARVVDTQNQASYTVVAFPGDSGSQNQITPADPSRRLELSSGPIDAFADSTVPDRVVATPLPPTPISQSENAIDWSSVILALWAVVAALLLARLASSFLVVGAILRRSHPVELQRISSVGNPRNVRFLIADESIGEISPMTCGLIKPVIVLPFSSKLWTKQRHEAVVLHELAHVGRRDWLLQTFANLACVLYWFNPLVWLVSKQLRLESERACDDLVITSGAVNPADYARHLVDLTRSMQDIRQLRSGAVAMAQPGKMEERLRGILAEKLNRGSVSKSAASWIVAAVLLIVGLTGSVRMVAAKAQPTTNGASSSPIGNICAVDLPGEGKVNVAALVDPDTKPESWWLPDGEKMPGPKTGWDQLQNGLNWPAFYNSGSSDDKRRVVLAIELNHSSANVGNLLNWQVIDVSDNRKLVPTQLWNEGYSTPTAPLEAEAQLPKSSIWASLRVGYPDRNWRDIGSWRLGGQNSVYSSAWHTTSHDKTVDPKLKIWLPAPRGVFPDAQVYVGKDAYWHSNNLPFSLRLVAVEKTGQSIYTPTYQYVSQATRDGYLQLSSSFEQSLKSIREFKLQKCSYNYTETPAFRVNPTLTADTKPINYKIDHLTVNPISDTADILGDTALLGNGISVKLLGICTPLSSDITHQVWWNPHASAVEQCPIANNVSLDSKALASVPQGDRLVTMAVSIVSQPRPYGPNVIHANFDPEPRESGTSPTIQWCSGTPSQNAGRLTYLVSMPVPEDTNSVQLNVDVPEGGTQDYQNIEVWKKGSANTLSAKSWTLMSDDGTTCQINSNGHSFTISASGSRTKVTTAFCQFIAVATDGEGCMPSVSFISTRGSGPFQDSITAHFDKPLSKIAEFKLQAPSYHWSRFTAGIRSSDVTAQ